MGDRRLPLYVHGVGHFHPDSEISNRFLEELDIGTSEAWILERVGIRSRRSVLPLDYIRVTRNADLRAAPEAAEYRNAELAARAAKLALGRAGVGPEDVGLVVCGSSAPDSLAPAEACMVARELGIEALAFDLNSACTSFWLALHVLGGMQAARLPDFVLAVAVDSLTQVVDYRDRAAAVLWGDGAAAAVLSTRLPAPARVLDTHLASAPGDAARVRVAREGYFSQDGRQVQMFAIKKSVEGFEALRALHGGGGLHFVGHQANLRVLDAVCERCGIAPGHHHANVEFYGNTGCAGAPSVLSMHWDKWRAGDAIGLVGVGAGLTWARALLRFEAEGLRE